MQRGGAAGYLAAGAAAPLTRLLYCMAWMDVTQTVLTMSGTVQPRERSLTGFSSPWGGSSGGAGRQQQQQGNGHHQHA